MNKYDDYLKMFKNYLSLTSSSYTCEAYYYNTRKYLNYCVEKNVDFINITYNDIVVYFLYLKDKNKKPATLNMCKNSIVCFYKCLVANNIILDKKILDIFTNLKLPQPEKTIRQYISPTELDEIIEMGISFCEYMNPLRLEAILKFLYYTGCRKGEVMRLKRENIDLKRYIAVIKLPTKGKEERQVYFPKHVGKVLSDYFRLEPEESNAFNLTYRQFGYLIYSLKDYLPKKNLTIHMFRHSFARMLAENGLDIKAAQKLLGHKNITTTEIYFDPDDTIIEKLYREKIK